MCAEAASSSPTACNDGVPAFEPTVYTQGISVPVAFSSSESSNCFELRITNCSFLGGLGIIFPSSAPPLSSPTARRPTIYVTIVDSLISLGNSAGSAPSQGAGAFVISSANATASQHYAFVFSMRNTVLRSYASITSTMLFKNVILRGAVIEVRDCEISRVIVTHASSCNALSLSNTPAIDSSISFVNTTIRVVAEMSHVNDVMFLTAVSIQSRFSNSTLLLNGSRVAVQIASFVYMYAVHMQGSAFTSGSLLLIQGTTVVLSAPVSLRGCALTFEQSPFSDGASLVVHNSIVTVAVAGEAPVAEPMISLINTSFTNASLFLIRSSNLSASSGLSNVIYVSDITGSFLSGCSAFVIFNSSVVVPHGGKLFSFSGFPASAQNHTFFFSGGSVLVVADTTFVLLRANLPLFSVSSRMLSDTSPRLGDSSSALFWHNSSYSTDNGVSFRAPAFGDGGSSCKGDDTVCALIPKTIDDAAATPGYPYESTEPVPACDRVPKTPSFSLAATASSTAPSSSPTQTSPPT